MVQFPNRPDSTTAYAGRTPAALGPLWTTRQLCCWPLRPATGPRSVPSSPPPKPTCGGCAHPWSTLEWPTTWSKRPTSARCSQPSASAATPAPAPGCLRSRVVSPPTKSVTDADDAGSLSQQSNSNPITPSVSDCTSCSASSDPSGVRLRPYPTPRTRLRARRYGLWCSGRHDPLTRRAGTRRPAQHGRSYHPRASRRRDKDRAGTVTRCNVEPGGGDPRSWWCARSARGCPRPALESQQRGRLDQGVGDRNRGGGCDRVFEAVAPRLAPLRNESSVPQFGPRLDGEKS